ncbi:MAG: hypothetical protein AMXMBFR13_49170 [Phycisphaerae bacterium]
MYEHLSSRVDQVIKLANSIAREYDQEYVGTEHVLLAIVREGTGVGARVLRDRGLGEQEVKAEIDKRVKASLEDTWVFGRLPGSPHFKNVIARAIEEARKLKSPEVCTEHLLLALLGERGCVACETLKALGLSTKSVRDDILNHAGAGGRLANKRECT